MIKNRFKIRKQNEKNNLYKKLKTHQKKLSKFCLSDCIFPNHFRRTHLSDDLNFKYGKKNLKELSEINVYVSVAGRMIRRRIMGKSSFLTLQDMSGQIQIYVLSSDLKDNFYYKEFKKWNLGYIIGVNGFLFKTKTGELTVFCKKIFLLTKSFLPFPDKFHGLENQEIRYRKRYLDIITNIKSRKTFITRSRIISSIRTFMIDKGFIEVETPMMQTMPGGANARPFVTYNKSLNMKMYLRIAPELYLKRLVVGGFEKVFEINRNFRNEGISPYHNPEFTMLEFYMAYSDYKDLIIFTEKLLSNIALKSLGTTEIRYGKFCFDFSKPFIKMTMKESIIQYCSKINLEDFDNINKLLDISKILKIDLKEESNLGLIKNKIFESIVKKKLIQPTFITEYPIEISPLSRRNDKNPMLADRFELFIAGNEIGNGFSELNDPKDQLFRFVNQSKKDNGNNCQNKNYDEDYITALKYGLPPTAGLGIGIDRLVMLMTNSSSIRDVILFPLLKPNFKKK